MNQEQMLARYPIEGRIYAYYDKSPDGFWRIVAGKRENGGIVICDMDTAASERKAKDIADRMELSGH